MNYDSDILCVLKEAGSDGLSMQKIARHVFNAHNSFFASLCYDDIYRYVKNYLYSNSKSSDSVIEHASRRGFYRLNMSSRKTQQLMLLFDEDRPEEIHIKAEDKSLSLFGDF